MPRLFHQTFWATDPKKLATDNIVNGNFSDRTIISSGNPTIINGWKIYKNRVYFGTSKIEGFSIPPALPRYSNDTGSVTSTYNYAFNSGTATGGSGITLSVTPSSSISVTGGSLHGPYMVSDNPFAVSAGDTIQFYWKGTAGTDEFDALVYFLNVITGTSIIAVDAARGTTAWTLYKKTFSAAEAGSYKLVVISGSWDQSLGRALGAEFAITGISGNIDAMRNLPMPDSEISISAPISVYEGDTIHVGVDIMYPRAVHGNLFWTANTNTTISSADIGNIALSGPLTVTPGILSYHGTLDLPVIIDTLSEGTETINVAIRTGSINGNIIGYTGNIEVTDERPGVTRFTYDADWISLEVQPNGGKDLDICIGGIGVGTTYLGWGFADTDGDWLKWAGDNTMFGTESVLFDVNAFKAAYPNNTEIKIDVRCAWYLTAQDNPVSLIMRFWKGGPEPIIQSQRWIRLSGTEFAVESEQKKILDVSGPGYIGTRLGMFTYNLSNFTGNFNIYDTSQHR